MRSLGKSLGKTEPFHSKSIQNQSDFLLIIIIGLNNIIKIKIQKYPKHFKTKTICNWILIFRKNLRQQYLLNNYF